ncbi:hypothetical protein [Pedobacter metabolipauper]|uniref:Lipoprotein n=1 Tax=Pedobacter metabolipauper TaxID=425513 RepID=A0A4R6SV52_9SPHI|nr:hypothetical protein [Pedobacter metabolipauper]TDQ09209.1 hypothetical protein ATK78_1363 [Pedobacter metabolipauper]
MKRYLFYLCLIFIVNLSCHTAKLDNFSKSVECIDFQVSDNNQFRLMYYNSNLDSLQYNYLQGSYTKQGDDFLLSSDTISNKNFDAILEEEKGNFEGTRIKVATNIYGDFISEYTTILHIGDMKYSFKGVNIDTLLNRVADNKLWVEIFFPNRYLNNTVMSPSYKSFITKKLPIENQTSNFLSIKIPINYELFFYKSNFAAKVKDLGDSIIIVDSGKKFLKCNLIKIK